MADETPAPATDAALKPVVEASGDAVKAAEQAATASSATEEQKPDEQKAGKSPIEKALEKANKEAEKYRLELKKYEDRDKTDAEKLEERATSAEARATTAEGKLLRLEVASSKGLPAELVARMQGNSREELEADAEELLTLVKPVKPSGGFDGGVRGSTEATTTKTPGEAHNDFLTQVVLGGRASS